MPAKLRNFLHPVLRISSNDYVDGSSFSVDCKPEIRGNDSEFLLSIAYKINLTNSEIRNLVQLGFARVVATIYCRETLLRRGFICDVDAGIFSLESGSAIGSVEIEFSIVAVQDMPEFRPNGINPEYGNQKFEIEEGDPLALADPIYLPISFKRHSNRSFIRIQSSDELHPDVYKILPGPSMITILMGTNMRMAYDLMFTDSSLKPYLFMTCYKDTFSHALEALVSDEYAEEFQWSEKLAKKCSDLDIDMSTLNSIEDRNIAALKLVGSLGVEKVIANVIKN